MSRKVGVSCSSCDATVADCDEDIRRYGRACCVTCSRTDTHQLLGRDGGALSERTVRDVLVKELIANGHAEEREDYGIHAAGDVADAVLEVLGIDPELPFEALQILLRNPPLDD